MAIIQSGATLDTLTIEPASKAARVSVRAPDVLGSYRLVAQTGTLPASLAASNLFTWRYSGAGTAVLRRIEIGLLVLTAYAQGNTRFSAYHTRTNFTQGTTNATLVNLTGNNAKKLTNMAAPNVTAYIATTLGIGGDAATSEDSTAFATDLLNMPSTVQPVSFTQGMHDLYFADPNGWAVGFRNTEGFRIKNDTSFAATGTGNFVVMVEWDEYAV